MPLLLLGGLAYLLFPVGAQDEGGGRAAVTSTASTAAEQANATAEPSEAGTEAGEADAEPSEEAAPEAAPDATAQALPPPPPCEVGDLVVAGDPLLYHATLILDLLWRLPPGFEPSDLVSLRQAGFDSDLGLRAVAIDDLRAMREGAQAFGLRLAVQSAYRSEAYQDQVHQGWVRLLGAEQAALTSARPGHSEHQLGTAVDLRSEDGPPAWDLEDWAQTPEGAWVAANAHRFGFVVSYPKDAVAVTCYDYEPWHLRWVGRELAAAVQASGQPLRAYLHAHHPPTERTTP